MEQAGRCCYQYGNLEKAQERRQFTSRPGQQPSLNITGSVPNAPGTNFRVHSRLDKG
jgi:hypothetical protein